MDQKHLRKLINEMADTCPSKDGYCFIKEFLLHLGQDLRVMIQIKLIEKFKFERSREVKNDIGWEGAFMEWIKNGSAEKFAELYDEEKSLTQLYKEIKNGIK